MRVSTRRWSYLLLATLLFLAPALSAQVLEDQIETGSYLFEPTNEEIEYALFKPSSYDGSEKAPLVILLHGLGGNPGQVIRYQGLTPEAEEHGFIVVAPFGYNSRGWYGSRGTGKSGIREVAEDPENLGELSEQDVANVIERTLEEMNIDRSRVYLMGHSMGGAGTWHFAMKMPDLWAGLAPMAPASFGEPEGLEDIKHIPVIVIQGDADRLVPVEGTRRWVARLEEIGTKHTYIEIPDGNHVSSITQNPELMSEIFDFLAAQSR